MAMGALGTMPAMINRKLAGRCVYTMVRTSPSRGASRADTSCESALSTPAAANVAPVAAYLATADAPETGRVYFVQGGQVRLFEGWTMTATIEQPGRWTVEGLRAAMPALQPSGR